MHPVIFLILYLTQVVSSAPSDRLSDHSDECIGYLEVGSNQGSTHAKVGHVPWNILPLFNMFTSATVNNAVLCH